MGLLDRFRNRSAEGPPSDVEPGQERGGSQGLAIAGYDRLKPRQIVDRLHELSQVELAAIEEHERAHEARPAVLSKLGYLRRGEPLPGYDALDPDQIGEELAKSNSERVRAVRDYERTFKQRRQVMDEAARVLPEAPQSANEIRAREEKSARVRANLRRPPGKPPA